MLNPELQQEQNKPPLDKMKDIFSQPGLKTFQKFDALETKMIDVPDPRLEDLLTISVWAEERKVKNPDWENNLEKTGNKALDALIDFFKQSPDPKKWSESLKAVSKSQGAKIVELIEKKIMVAAAQKKGETEDYKKQELSKRISDLDTLHTKLDFFVKNLH